MNDRIPSATQQERDLYRSELLAVIRSLDKGAIAAEQSSDSLAKRHLRHLQEQCPIRYLALAEMGLLQEAGLAAQVRYERMRQDLLAQGASLASAQEQALQEFILIPSEEEQREQSQELVTQEQEAANQSSWDLVHLIGRLPQVALGPAPF